MALGPRFEPAPYWWEASAITTVPPLFPLVQVRVKCLAQEEHNMMSPARALFKTALTDSSSLSIKPAPSAPHSIEGGGGLILCQLQFITNSFHVPDKPLHVTI